VTLCESHPLQGNAVRLHPVGARGSVRLHPGVHCPAMDEIRRMSGDGREISCPLIGVDPGPGEKASKEAASKEKASKHAASKEHASKEADSKHNASKEASSLEGESFEGGSLEGVRWVPTTRVATLRSPGT